MSENAVADSPFLLLGGFVVSLALNFLFEYLFEVLVPLLLRKGTHCSWISRQRSARQSAPFRTDTTQIGRCAHLIVILNFILDVKPNRPSNESETDYQKVPVGV